MFCSKCGAPNEDDAEYCGNCGAVLEAGNLPAAEPPAPVEEAADAAVEATASEASPDMDLKVVPLAAPPAEEPPRGVPPVSEPGRTTAVGPGARSAVPSPQPAVAPQRPNPETAFLIEFLAGIFGLLGIGYLFAGKTNEGVVRLVVWLVYTVLAWVAVGLLSAIVVGLICIPFQLVVQIGIPLWSANKLKKQLLAEG